MPDDAARATILKYLDESAAEYKRARDNRDIAFGTARQARLDVERLLDKLREVILERDA